MIKKKQQEPKKQKRAPASRGSVSGKMAAKDTDRRVTEAEIAVLNRELSSKVAALEAANREIQAFVYSVSHDLRAPLRHISEFARFMAEDYSGLLDEQGKDYLARIRQGTAKMSQLIDDLLDMSRIAQLEMSLSAVDLTKTALSIIEDLREEEPSRNVEVLIAYGITADTDPRLIEVVLSNLLGNAWKFTSKIPKGRIEFGAIRGPAPDLGRDHPGLSPEDLKDRTVYYVKDNGAGFNRKLSENMFLPFHRLHTDEEFEGTGIGLAIVDRIIRRHGGKVWAEGQPGNGAIFYFTLE